MDVKCIKDPTLQQLQALVAYMENNLEFARGPAVLKSKRCTEEHWKQLASKVNSLGPPLMTINEWKEIWEDLILRIKYKIAKNVRSMQRTEDGLYNMHFLSDWEQTVERILFLSKAAAPSGKVFGLEPPKMKETIQPIDSCFQALTDTPPRRNKVMAVITPTRVEEGSQSLQQQSSRKLQQPHTSDNVQRQQKRQHQTEQDLHGCSSAKNIKYIEEQTSLIDRQEVHATQLMADANQLLADSAKRMADCAKRMADSSKRMAAAAEVQAVAAKRSSVAAEAQIEILQNLSNIVQHLAKNK